MAVGGRTMVAQDGRETILHPSDFCIYDSARPCRIACHDPFRLLVLKIPKDQFAARRQPPNGITATAVRGYREHCAAGL
jgi:AraC-binding-like domain